MSTFMNDVVQAIRSLRNRPWIAACAVATLAIAIAANVTIFSAANGLLFERLPFADPDRLVLLWEVAEHDDRLPVSLPDFLDWEERARSFENLAAFRGRGFIYGDPGGARWIGGLEVTADLFELLGVRPTIGRAFTEREELERERVAVIGEHLWRERGGRPLGEDDTIRLDGVPYRIVGVLPIDFRLPSAGATDVWVPIGRDPLLMNRGTHSNTLVLGRLRSETSLEAARAEMRGIAAQLAEEYPGTNRGVAAAADLLARQLTRQFRAAIFVLWGAVFLVLLIACANVTNLLLVRAEARKRELAIRSALGATRGRMVRQLLLEGVVLAVFGAAAGLVLASWAVGALRGIGDNRVITDQIEIDTTVVFFTIGLTLLAGVLSGLLPALRHFEGALIGRGALLGSRDGSARTSRAMVAVQIAVALALTVGATLGIASFAKLAAVHPGFDPAGVVQAQISLPAAMRQNEGVARQTWLRLLERARALPGVESAALAHPFPLTGSRSTTNVALDGIPEPLPGEQTISLAWQIVTPDYFRVLRIPIVQGRGFREEDDGGRVLLVNRALANRFWPGQEVVGKRIRFGRTWQTIVGVTESTRTRAIDDEPEPIVYRLWSHGAPAEMNLAVRARSGAAASLVSAVRQAIRETDPDLPLDAIHTAEELIDDSAMRARLLAGMLGTFSGVALMLAMLGTWGVTAWSVARRSRELGVRMALGAGRGTIFLQLLREGALTIAMGAGGGILLAVPLAASMRSILYGVEPGDPLLLALPLLLLGATTLVAIALPARRATRVDPSSALREE